MRIIPRSVLLVAVMLHVGCGATEEAAHDGISSSEHALSQALRFDDVPSGTVIDARYPGVTFSNGLNGGSVYAVKCLDGSGNTGNGISILPTDPIFAAEEGAVDATFAALQDTVSIDARGWEAPFGPLETPRKPFLQAFDAQGKLLQTLYYDLTKYKEWQTLRITRPTKEIRRIRFSSQNNWLGLSCPAPSCPSRDFGGFYAEFDNLRYEDGTDSIRYVGCYTDDPVRALPFYLGSPATPKSCVAAARANGYTYAAVQWYGQCFAGNSIGYARASESECNTPCDADSSQTCGGGWRNSIYKTDLPPALDYKGCFYEGSSHELPVLLMESGATPETCVAEARRQGYPYAGVQFYGQCFAGYSYGRNGREDDRRCDTPCTVDPTQDCGGAWLNSVYGTGAAPPSDYKGCFKDEPSRALPVILMETGATPATCIAAARENGYAFAAVQWYGGCFAGNWLGYSQVAESDCNTPCDADPTRICGGGWRNSVYETGVQAPALRPLGCYTDAPERALPVLLIESGSNVQRCVDLARSRGYAYAGLQSHGECLAGNALGYCKVDDAECNTLCTANWQEVCGGDWRNSVYETGVPLPVPSQRPIAIINPHQSLPFSYVGSVHNHTVGTGGGGGRKKEVSEVFKRRGYDFAAFTDHDKANTGRLLSQGSIWHDWEESECPSGMVCFWGTEASQIPHQLFFGWSKVSVEELLEQTNGFQSYRLLDDPRVSNHRYDIEHNVSVLPHPSNREKQELFPMPAVGRPLYFEGLEFNEDNGPGNEENAFGYWGWALRSKLEIEGRANATPIWGFTSDDFQPEQVERIIGGATDANPPNAQSRGWLVVNSDWSTPNSDSIRSNIKAGNFFAVYRDEDTAGIVRLQKPSVSIDVTGNNEIHVAPGPQAVSVRFVDACGAVRATAAGDAVYAPDGDEGFVRVVVETSMEGNALRVFSQPISIKRR